MDKEKIIKLIKLEIKLDSYKKARKTYSFNDNFKIVNGIDLEINSIEKEINNL